MNCSNCGNSLLPNSKFCDSCGTQVSSIGSAYGEPSQKAQSNRTYSQPQSHGQQDLYPNQPKKLYRSRGNRVVAGVCGGIGEYYNTDPNLIRILFIIALFSGFGVIAYLIAILIIPESPYDPWKEPSRQY